MRFRKYLNAKQLTALRLKLDEHINAFLAERRESTGGWAPFSAADEAALKEIVETLAVLKWSPDADGDLPLDYWLVNRTHEYMPGFMPLPYSHQAADQAEQLRQLLQANYNLGLAQDDLNNRIRRLGDQINEHA